MSQCEACKKKSTEWRELSFHRFPKDYASWVGNMGRQNWVPREFSALCSEHFTSNCFELRGSRKHLKVGSVPTVFRTGGSRHAETIWVPAEPIICIKRERSDSFTDELETYVVDMPVDDSLQVDPLCSTSSAANYACIKPEENRFVSQVSIALQTDLTSDLTSHIEECLRHDHYYADTPRTVRWKLEASRKKLAAVRKEKKALKQSVKRLKMTVYLMKDVIKKLKGNKAVCDNDEK